MLKVSDIREFIRLLDETSLDELHIETDALKLTLKKSPAAVVSAPVLPVAPTPQTAPAIHHAENETHIAQASVVARAEASESFDEAGTALIESPMVGTFYNSPSPTALSYVEIGAKVTEKSVVCIVEAMKLMNEIEADVRGEIIEVLAENGQLVEYGQPLFRVKLA